MNYEDLKKKVAECLRLSKEKEQDRADGLLEDRNALKKELDDAERRLSVQQRYIQEFQGKIRKLETERDTLQELVDSVDWDQQRAGRDTQVIDSPTRAIPVPKPIVVRMPVTPLSLGEDMSAASVEELQEKLARTESILSNYILEGYKDDNGKWFIFPFKERVHIKFPVPQKIVSITGPGIRSLIETLTKFADQIESEGNLP
jgi:hypothetical protein